MESNPFSLATLLCHHSEKWPEAEALVTRQGFSLTYRRLWEQVRETADALRRSGLCRGDRVAVVAPDGPGAAIAQLAVASFAIAAPLNPKYSRAQFEEFFVDLDLMAVIVEQDSATEAWSAAQAAGLPILTLSSRPGLATPFAVTGAIPGASRPGASSPGPSNRDPRSNDVWSAPEDVAYVLLTSGSSAKPKRVGLRHCNLMVAAAAISRCYRLTPEDRCLNLVPMFHGFGLVSGLLSSLWAGATVACGPEFQAVNFASLIEELHPTWYTAVPAMHRTIMDQLRAQGGGLPSHRLRFTISRAAPLPATLQDEVEQVLGIPILQGYGATETTTLATCTSLPPGVRKPGSVGQSLGPEIVIVDEQFRLLPRGQTGEVVIRGQNVVAGYEDAPEQTRESFFESWFRTGDLGRLDSEGYLFLTGRSKEIINRGGEKISPYEVEDVLLRHPLVVEAACFPVSHDRLGEVVAAAVVLRQRPTQDGPPDAAGERRLELDLRRFVAEQKIPFMVPETIQILDQLPLTHRGKVDRRALAARFQAEVHQPAGNQPRTDRERQLLEFWEKALEVHPIGVTDDFFDLGGTSLMAARLFEEIGALTGTRLPLALLLQAPTVEKLARLLDEKIPPAAARRSLIALQPSGSRPPFFCVHGLLGKSLIFRGLSAKLGPDQPFLALEAQEIEQEDISAARIEDMAVRYLAEVRAVQPNGPYYLGGLSTGGMIAFEMARLLHEQSEAIALVALFDPRLPSTVTLTGDKKLLMERLAAFLRRVAHSSLRQNWRLLRTEILPNLVHFRDFKRTDLAPEDVEGDPTIIPPDYLLVIKAAQLRAANLYDPRPLPCRGVLFLAKVSSGWIKARTQSVWAKLFSGGMETVWVPSREISYFIGEDLPAFAEQVRAVLDQAVHTDTAAPPLDSEALERRGCTSTNCRRI